MSGEDNGAIEQKLASVRLLAMDVDGVLTDGSIIYTGAEAETKRFHVADGLGIQLAMNGGLVVAWITGRASPAVEKRANELGVTHLFQNTANKAEPLARLMAAYTLSQAHIAYIGDDLNDFTAFSLAGVKIAPANAASAIKAIADLVTVHEGGHGAVREVTDVILKSQGKWNDAVTAYLAELLKT